jgi:hypothetical protein
MREVKNLAEAKALVARYKELVALREFSKDIEGRSLQYLTGFGLKHSCSLCSAIDTNCTVCIWGPKDFNCMNKNYHTIMEYETDLTLVKDLLKTRIKLLTRRIKSWEEEN